jgi:hypothetical protein
MKPQVAVALLRDACAPARPGMSILRTSPSCEALPRRFRVGFFRMILDIILDIILRDGILISSQIFARGDPVGI